MRWLAWTASLALVATVPLVLDTYFVYLGSLIAVYIVIALGLNLLLGYTGQISLGHAGFVAIGAYGSTILTLRLGLPFVVAALVGAALAAIAGLLVGLPALKVRGYYLALVTLAFGEIVQVVARQAKLLTGGNDGLTVPAPELAGLRIGTPAHSYYLLWVVALISIVFTMNVARSRAGRAFQCVRDSEIAAQAVGISLTRYKLYAFVLSAFLAGLAGALYSVLNLYLHPDDFNFGRSVLYLMMVVVGGLGTTAGSVLGAVLLAALPEGLRRFQDFQELVFAALLLGSIILMPPGLVGLVRRLSASRPLDAGRQ
jgi:ABC-type branched-subunit amino acid transport system permease subunit